MCERICLSARMCMCFQFDFMAELLIDVFVRIVIVAYFPGPVDSVMPSQTECWMLIYNTYSLSDTLFFIPFSSAPLSSTPLTRKKKRRCDVTLCRHVKSICKHMRSHTRSRTHSLQQIYARTHAGTCPQSCWPTSVSGALFPQFLMCVCTNRIV